MTWEVTSTETTGPVVLTSSGVDSTICGDWYPQAVKLFVAYGHPEEAAEQRAVQRLFPDVRVIQVRGEFRSPDGVFVPARNLFFACLAAQLGDEIILGAMADDQSPDKTPQALADMSAVLTAFSKKTVRVQSPLIHLLKHEAVRAYLQGGGSPERIKSSWSCYSNQPTQCWDCPACFRWVCAMIPHGLDVPLPSDRLIETYLGKLHRYPPGRVWAICNTVRHHPSRRLYLVDIDGTVCEEGPDHRTAPYDTRRPVTRTVAWLRRVVAAGAWIVLNTSRPACERTQTEVWLRRHEVPWHGLLMDRPAADRYVDDRSLRPDEL